MPNYFREKKIEARSRASQGSKFGQGCAVKRQGYCWAGKAGKAGLGNRIKNFAQSGYAACQIRHEKCISISWLDGGFASF